MQLWDRHDLGLAAIRRHEHGQARIHHLRHREPETLAGVAGEAEIGGGQRGRDLLLIGVRDQPDARVAPKLPAERIQGVLGAVADDGEPEIVRAPCEQALQAARQHPLALGRCDAAEADEPPDAVVSPAARARPERGRGGGGAVDHMDAAEARIELRRALRRPGRVRHDHGSRGHLVDRENPAQQPDGEAGREIAERPTVAPPSRYAVRLRVQNRG